MRDAGGGRRARAVVAVGRRAARGRNARRRRGAASERRGAPQRHPSEVPLGDAARQHEELVEPHPFGLALLALDHRLLLPDGRPRLLLRLLLGASLRALCRDAARRERGRGERRAGWWCRASAAAARGTARSGAPPREGARRRAAGGRGGARTVVTLVHSGWRPDPRSAVREPEAPAALPAVAARTLRRARTIQGRSDDLARPGTPRALLAVLLVAGPAAGGRRARSAHVRHKNCAGGCGCGLWWRVSKLMYLHFGIVAYRGGAGRGYCTEVRSTP